MLAVDMSATLLLALIVTAPGPDPLVQFEARALPIERLLEELTPVVGQELRAAPEVRRQVLVVSVRNVSREELLAKIAEVAGGRWRLERGIQILHRPAEIARAEEQLDFELRLEAARKAFEDSFKGIAPSFGDAEATQLFRKLTTLKVRIEAEPQNGQLHKAYQDLWEQGPFKRALVRLLQTIPIEEIARIEHRTVFSLQPTSRQRPLGSAAREIVNDLAREQALWTRKVAELDPARSFKGDDTVGDPLSTGSTVLAEPKSVKIVARRTTDSILFNLYVDASWPQAQFWGRDPRLQEAYSLARGTDPLPGEQVSLSPLSLEFNVLCRTMFEGTPPTPSQELKALLLDPVRHEPLSLAPTDGLFALGSHRRANLVASVPDSALGMVSFAAPERLTLETLVQILEAGPQGMRFRSERDWLLGTPRSPIAAKKLFTSREALRRATGSIEEHGRLTLLESALFAANASDIDRAYEGIGTFLLMLMDRGVASVFDGSNWGALKILGSLSDAQRRTLEAGGSVPFNQLNQRQRSFVEALAFADFINNHEFLERGTSRVVHPSLEPTEVLAGGLPGDGRLSLGGTKSPAIFAFRNDESGRQLPFRTANEATIAFLLHARERGGRGLGPEITGYAMGHEVHRHLRLVFGPEAWCEYTLLEQDLDPGARPVPWTELPTASQEAIQKNLGQLRASPTGVRRQDPPEP
jgi:hypothetical protein